MAAHHGEQILFACASGAGPLQPMLALAGELRRRGEPDPWFACTDDGRADVERVAATPGGAVRFASVGPARPELAPESWDDESIRSITHGPRASAYGTYVARSTDPDDRHGRHLRCVAVIDELRPALAVVDSSSTWALDAVMSRAVPFVISVSVPPSNFLRDILPPSYPTPMSGLPFPMSPSQRAYNAAFRRELGDVFADPDSQRRPSEYADAALALLAHTVFGFEYPFSGAPANLRMVGPMVPADVRAAVDGDLGAWLGAHESIVHIGFGPVMRPSRGQVDAIVELARRLAPAHHVLWELPASRHGLLPPGPERPANLRVEPRLPAQLDVLAHPHVRVSVNHAGADAVHEGLYFGKPQLVMPFWLDCHDSAVRLLHSGAGLAVEHLDRPDVDDLAAKVGRLLGEDSFRRQAQLWSRRMREAGGVTAAADLILTLRDGAGAARAGADWVLAAG